MAVRDKENTLHTRQTFVSYDTNNSVINFGIATEFQDCGVYLKGMPVYDELIGTEVESGQKRYDYDNMTFALFKTASSMFSLRAFLMKCLSIIEREDPVFDTVEMTSPTGTSLAMMSRDSLDEEQQEFFSSDYVFVLSKGEDHPEIAHCFEESPFEFSSDEEGVDLNMTTCFIEAMVNCIDNVTSGTGSLMTHLDLISFNLSRNAEEKPAPSTKASGNRSRLRGGKALSARKKPRTEEDLGTDEDVGSAHEELEPKQRRSGGAAMKRRKDAAKAASEESDDAAEDVLDKV